MPDDKVGAPGYRVAQGLNEHQLRLADALALCRQTNHPPRLDTIPAVMVNWDMDRGILTIAHCKAAELETHIVYLRVADIQTTFGQMMDAAGQARAERDPYLKAVGDVMAGRPVTRLVK